MMNSFRLYGAAVAIALVSGFAAHAQGSGDRMTGLKLSGDEPIQIESARLDVDENESVGVFSGNVTVVQGDTTMKSGRMRVYYAGDAGSATTGSANIDRIEVDGGVYVKSQSQVATGDRATFDMQTQVLVMSGDEVVLSEGENVIVGCRLTVQMNSGQAKLESCKDGKSAGRVKMLLTPGSQDR
ncbi:LptA/OstA family protein [Nitratireductor thuwali]|uniref:Lipopolysaccharide export system protein LptA n=1 Tax=Nitratireductor thuwali TaxID=2267699 RepID=A0ABY5MQ01_9HYPH|nr:Lipopolysaccharide export system protein LptA [Nitratireductor thuwali]